MPVWWIYGIAVPPWTHHSTKVWEKLSQRIKITFGKTKKHYACIKLLKDTFEWMKFKEIKTQSINTSNAKEHQNLCRWWDSNSQPLSYKKECSSYWANKLKSYCWEGVVFIQLVYCIIMYLSLLNCSWLLIWEVQWFYWTHELLVQYQQKNF